MKKITKELTINQVLSNINESKYVLPAIQRNFVWNQKQIIALYDSLLVGYPISTFLFWNLDEETLNDAGMFYKLINEATFGFSGNPKQTEAIKIEANKLNDNSTAILDGQQRLTSLFLTLYGKIKKLPKNGRLTSGASVEQLYLNLDSGYDFFNDEDVIVNDEGETLTKQENNYTFDFKFSEKSLDKSQYFNVRDIFEFKNNSTRSKKIDNYINIVNEKHRENAKEILNLFCKRIFDEKSLLIAEISESNLNETLELFVRFNNGGSKLTKSDLVFSTIQAVWPESKSKIDTFVEKINNNVFDFTRDFIIRSALVIYGKNTNISKTLITVKIVDDLKNNWNKFEEAIEQTLKFIKNRMGISSTRELSSQLALIPLIYHCYCKNSIVNETDAKKYLYRSLINNIFSSRTNSLLAAIKKIIDDNNGNLNIDYIAEQVPSYKFSADDIQRILDLDKSKTTELILFLIENNNVYTSFNNNEEYHQDHIHPISKFKNDNNIPYNLEQTKWNDWKFKANKLPNLQLLKGLANKEKNAKHLIEWLDQANTPSTKEFREQNHVEDNISLQFKDFDELYKFREDYLKKKLLEMLI